MPSDVPSRLAYLAPVFDALARFDPEELGDDNPEAIGIVEDAVRKRLAGMDAQQAEDTIESDVETLQAYLTTPAAPTTAHYVYGVLFGMTMYGDFDELTDQTSD